MNYYFNFDARWYRLATNRIIEWTTTFYETGWNVIDGVNTYIFLTTDTPNPRYTGSTVLDDQIYGGVNYECNINPDSDLQVGIAAAAKLEFVTDNSYLAVMNNQFNWQTKMMDEQSFTNQGVFNILSVEKTERDKYKCIAYDNLIFFDKIIDDWYNNIKTNLHPHTGATGMNLAQFFASLCNYIGVSYNNYTGVNYNYDIRDTFTPNKLTGRTLLGYIAAVAAGFITADYQGKVTIGHFTNNLVELDNSIYKKCLVGDYEVDAIDRVHVGISADEQGVIRPQPVPTGTNTLEINYNPLLFANSETDIGTAVQNIYETVHEYVYSPTEIELFSDRANTIKVGDIITVHCLGVTTAMYVFNKTVNSQGVKIACTGNKVRLTQNDSQSEQIIAMAGRFTTIETEIGHIQTTVGQLGDEVTDLSGDFTELDTFTRASISTINQTVSGIETKVETKNRIFEGTAPTSGMITGDLLYYTGTTTSQFTNGRYYRYDSVLGWQLTDDKELSTSVSRVTQTVDGVTIDDGHGQTVINGAKIKTGTILPGSILFGDTGVIKWSNLTSDCQSYIEGLEADLPPYIKSTYIDFSTVQSPYLAGNEIGLRNGALKVEDAAGAYSYGYIGLGEGKDASDQSHYGIIMASSDDTTLSSDDNYIIITDQGIRLQSGDYTLLVKPDGVYYQEPDENPIKLGYARFG